MSFTKPINTTVAEDQAREAAKEARKEYTPAIRKLMSGHLIKEQEEQARSYGRNMYGSYKLKQILDFSLAGKEKFMQRDISGWSGVDKLLADLIKFGVLTKELKTSQAGYKYELYTITNKGHKWLLFAVTAAEGKENDNTK